MIREISHVCCFNYSLVYLGAWVCVSVHLSGFVRATTSTFMHRFQNNLA